MKKFTISVFIICALALGAAALFMKHSAPNAQNPIIRAKIIKPETKTATATEETPFFSEEEEDPELPTSLIKLANDELLLNAVSVDINNDSMDDQIISIKKASSSNIFLVTGIYNQKMGEYQRMSEIETEITQTKTFSFSVSDITGDHVNSLVYTGLTNQGESVLKVYLPDLSKQKFSYTLIADLVADGSIFIQQIQRSDPYSFSQTQGESFPIWVYSSDTSRSSESLDQIQTMYNWDAVAHKYLKVSESRVTGKKLEAAELRRIQDGTTATFENFLKGLWYKSSTTDGGVRYIFFDTDAREIIFSAETTQELYVWTTSSLRRNGIYLTSMNKSINNLIRRFDIALNGIDEIKVKVNDDVKMVIGEETLWDGTYKKITLKSTTPQTVAANSDILKKLESGTQIWTTASNISIIIKNSQFTASTETWTAEGAVAASVVNGQTLIEFRAISGQKILEGFYLPKLEKTQHESEQREVLTLTPVTVSATGFFSTGAAPIKMERSFSAR